MKILSGQKASPGIALGVIHYLKRRKPDVTAHPADDVQRELDRVEAAVQEAVRQLEELRGIALEKMGKDEAGLFEVHAMMLTDLDYRDSITNIITEEKVNAEYAVSKTADIFAQMFLDMEKDYMKARAADVRDVSGRLLDVLQGNTPFLISSEKPVIIAAKDLSPSETVQLDKDKILAFVTSGGSNNSHTAIFARNRGIPAVAALGAALDETCNGKEAVVDGEGAALYLEPDRETVEKWAQRRGAEQREKAELAALIGLPSKTLDNREIKLFANIGSPGEADAALANDAEGIGLFRSEFIYLESKNFPAEEEQYRAYKKAAEKMQGKRVIIRTLDIGADKQAGYFGLPHEENPALGLRGLRICLTRPEIFITQLRAIYRASAHGNVAVMFPMVASLWELREAKEIAAQVRSRLKAEQVPYSERVPLGIMIETPAAAMMSDELAKEADFFSVGTNDLTQYTLAADRQNNALGRFVDTRHPALLRLLELAAKNAHAVGIPIGICGELGADRELTQTFIRMGIDELSVPPPAVLPLRKHIRGMKVD
ncbi:MAG: phosphoenolpyruvate--protein phosphotransferase [Treponema sp.]|jgi:phosphotransferase system enzyme I (PtsI)|nr:phosphoenolpyruvate--protein phosphotransferase [Treponema sp.]